MKPAAAMTVARIVPVVVVITLGLGVGGEGARGLLACEGAEVDPWVTQLRDRVLRFNGLAEYALETYGPPVSCEGSVTTEFDGAKYGRVLLEYEGGTTLEVETMPPEASSVTLRSPTGFGDAGSVRAELVAYAVASGLDIDWDVPEVSAEGQERVESYWHPEPGFNASAALIFFQDVLIAVRFSMAL